MQRARSGDLPIIQLYHSSEAVPVPSSPKDEPEEAYSAFSKSQRRWIVALAAAGSFFSPITANVYFPAIPTIAEDLQVSVQAVNLTVTLYLIAQGAEARRGGNSILISV
jgi:hypothetical protein